MKYIILADSNNTSPFILPRHLTKINGEELVSRTIRLLKENGVKDIIITSHDKRFDNLGATRYEPLHNEYDPVNLTGYWLNAFPIELLNEPTIYLFGDVYYSENAIKTILETPTDSALFFCTYHNESELYIKHHDEPLAYKVIDTDMFKENINKVKQMKDEGICCREPVVWELYRTINNQYINEHKMTSNYVAINDESCDIDTLRDIVFLERKIGGNSMVKAQATQVPYFTLERFGELKNIKRANINKNKDGFVYANDIFECSNELAEYLLGANDSKITVIKVLEVIPEEVKEEKPIEKPAMKMPKSIKKKSK